MYSLNLIAVADSRCVRSFFGPYIHHLGDAAAGSEPIFSCQKTVIPAESGVFIPFRTNPEVAADWAKGRDLIVDRQVRESDKAIVLPGICSAINGTPYCFVVNLGLHDTTIHPNVKLGTARVGGGEVQMSDPWTPCAPAEEGEGVHGVEGQRSAAPPGARQFLEEKLKLQQNPLMAEDPGLRDRVLDLFEENFGP